MKKLLAITLGILFYLATAPAIANSGPVRPVPSGSGPTLEVKVEFGRLKKGCRGFGICKIYIITDWAGTPVDDPAMGEGSAWVEGGKLTIALSRSSMTPTTLNTYFDGGTFRMEEDYELPEEAATALGIKAYTIRTGNYAIQRSGTDGATLKITF